ncbi:MAG: hypothetical protein Q8P57_01135 [Candidatus Pacearchaeota archaeon]|nr:hypothetical protein [Candidatus Pacearchaeota archaeon]
MSEEKDKKSKESEKLGKKIFIWSIVILVGLILFYNWGHSTDTSEPVKVSVLDKVIEKEGLTDKCGDEYNALVGKYNEAATFSEEKTTLLSELHSKSRECERHYLSLQMYIKDNEKSIKSAFEERGRDYYNYMASIESQMKFYQEARN